MVVAKPLAYLQPISGDFEILDLRSKPVGYLNLDVIVLNQQGNPATEKDFIRSPETELLKKPLSFVLNLNQAKGLRDIYQVKKDLVIDSFELTRMAYLNSCF